MTPDLSRRDALKQLGVVPVTDALETQMPGRNIALGAESAGVARVHAGYLVVRFADGPPTLHIETSAGTAVQTLVMSATEPGLSTHGTRAPVQWLIGSQDGWAMFVHQPYGAFDLTGEVGIFTPAPPRGGSESGVVGAASGTQASLAQNAPLDVFIIASRDPAVVMREHARIIGRRLV